MRFLVPLAAISLVLLAAACGDEGEGGDVDVTLQEWSVETNKESLPEGPINLTIKNDGAREHELVIVRTDVAVDDLPTKDDGSFDEDAGGVDVEQEIEEIEDGEETGRTYTLDPGSYVLLCNIVENIDGTETSHFEQGMRTAFTITKE
ncbi:MAG: hypothetical protein WD904_10115 [Dehalococcoidia bacterium]